MHHVVHKQAVITEMLTLALCEDLQEWVEALDKEYWGFKDRNKLAIVKLPKGARILGTVTLTRWEYNKDNGTPVKYKVYTTSFPMLSYRKAWLVSAL